MRLGFLLLALLGADTSPRRSHRSSHLPRGHTLVTYHKGIVELDAKGKELWRFKRDGLRSAHLLADNTVLVVDGTQRKLLIVDRKGEVRWKHQFAGTHLFHGAPAGDGSFWVGGKQGNRGFLIRVDRTGAIKQQLDAPSCLTFCVLRTGGILVNQHEQSKLSELNKAGQETWEWQGSPNHYGVERLANGHTILGRSNDVVELDRDGRTVWTCQSPAGNYHYAVKRLKEWLK